MSFSLGCALALVDSEGLEALTMRRLGADVGVEAASLYYHVSNKEALLDGVVARMRSEVRLPDPMPEDLIDIMGAIFAEYRRVLAAHPHLISMAGRRVETDPESGLVVLTRAGFAENDAVDLWQSMLAFVVGFSMFSSTAAESVVSDLPPGLARRMQEWRDDTCVRTLRMILGAYSEARARTPGGDAGQ